MTGRPDPNARCAPARSSHLHVLLNGLRPRGLSPPRRISSRSARVCCNSAGQGPIRFLCFLLLLPSSLMGQSFVSAAELSSLNTASTSTTFPEPLTPFEEYHLHSASSHHQDVRRPLVHRVLCPLDVALRGCGFCKHLSMLARSPSRRWSVCRTEPRRCIAAGMPKFSSSMGFWFPLETFFQLPLNPTHPCRTRSRFALRRTLYVYPVLTYLPCEQVRSLLGFSTSKNG